MKESLVLLRDKKCDWCGQPADILNAAGYACGEHKNLFVRDYFSSSFRDLQRDYPNEDQRRLKELYVRMLQQHTPEVPLCYYRMVR